MTISPQNKKNRIGKRLETVAEIAAVRLSCENESIPLCAIDVGTDHAKLPMYLLKEYGFSFVTATDINEGPCESARKNLKQAGKFFTERTNVIQTDGLSGLSNVPCNRIICAGMGGELIRDILSKADFIVKEPKKIKLILQPQSKEDVLRKYLYENGYEILDEKTVEDCGKIYSVISAVYDGKIRETSLLSLYFGEINLKNPDEIFMKKFNKKYKIFEKNILLRKQNKSNFSPIYDREQKLFCEMKKYMEEGGKYCAENL